MEVVVLRPQCRTACRVLLVLRGKGDTLEDFSPYRAGRLLLVVHPRQATHGSQPPPLGTPERRRPAQSPAGHRRDALRKSARSQARPHRPKRAHCATHRSHKPDTATARGTPRARSNRRTRSRRHPLQHGGVVTRPVPVQHHPVPGHQRQPCIRHLPLARKTAQLRHRLHQPVHPPGRARLAR